LSDPQRKIAPTWGAGRVRTPYLSVEKLIATDDARLDVIPQLRREIIGALREQTFRQ
jgi:hypothetical protein